MSNVKIDMPGEHVGVREKRGIFLVCTRWMLLAAAVLYSYICRDRANPLGIYFGIVVVMVIYNLIVTVYILKAIDKVRIISRTVIYLDTIIISLLASQSGGEASDIYILYFFVIGHCCIFSDFYHTIKVGIVSILAYTFSSIYANGVIFADIDYWRLGLRVVFLLLASTGVLAINSEIKKYGEMHKREFKLARTDRLTGLANRHYLEQKLNDEMAYSKLSNMPISILIFDIDNFKKFNDTYGHVWGDKLLTLFSDIIKQNIRKSDIPVRYGGEEFLILIRDLDIDKSKAVSERIRKQLEKQHIYIGCDDNRRNVTVSCGIAQYPKDAGDIREVIELADKALYRAKEMGKNMVISYGEIKNYK